MIRPVIYLVNLAKGSKIFKEYYRHIVHHQALSHPSKVYNAITQVLGHMSDNTTKGKGRMSLNAALQKRFKGRELNTVIQSVTYTEPTKVTDRPEHQVLWQCSASIVLENGQTVSRIGEARTSKDLAKDSAATSLAAYVDKSEN